jgi:hypothetical protein
VLGWSAGGQTISELIRSVLLQQIAVPNRQGNGAADETLLADLTDFLRNRSQLLPDRGTCFPSQFSKLLRCTV